MPSLCPTEHPCAPAFHPISLRSSIQTPPPIPQTFGTWHRNTPGPFWKTKSTLSSKRRRKFCSLCGEGQAHTLALKRLEVIKCFLMECRRLSKLVQRKCFSSQSILNSVPMFFPLARKHSSEIALPCRNFCPREHLHAICQWCLLALKCVPETLFLCKPGGLGH